MQPDEGTLSALLRAADSGPADALATAVRDLFGGGDSGNALLYLSDYKETLLRPVPERRGDQEGHSTLKIEGTLPGRAYTNRELVRDDRPGSNRVWVPVMERSEPIGVLELAFDALDEERHRLALDAGLLIGHLLVTARNYTDVYELLRRRRDMSLAAEMHWEILPARNYAGPSIAICGDVEPAYDVGGDSFDYCVNGDIVDVTIMDAMGHGLEAALLSTQSVGAYRYARRQDTPLAQIPLVIDDALERQFGGEKFVTGFFGRLDTSSGRFGWVCAGHVPPLLMRDGRVEAQLDSTPGCPMGLGLLEGLPEHHVTLQADDGVCLYSDGVVEAKSPAGQDFTFERLAGLIEEHHKQGPLAEAVHRVIDEVMVHTAGPLRDDATCLLLRYVGPS